MKFMLPVGGIIDNRFGILTAPNHIAVPVGIVRGMEWGIDAGCKDGPDYVKRLSPDFFAWLDSMMPYRSTCRFVAGNDVVGDALRTLEAFDGWYQHFTGWSLAFVAQDGQEDLPLPGPEKWDVLFVGGSTGWKVSQAAVDVIKRAQALNKRIHIGRVNWGARYRFFRQLKGSEKFTCDGTRTRFEGTVKTVRAWAGYQAQPPLFSV